MPVHNAARYLAAAVQSILSQTFGNFELICINDGSDDESLSIIEQFRRDDPRVRIISLPRQGLITALNTGLREARAPYVARMDADDIALPGRFDAQYTHMERNPNLWVLGTRTIWIDEHDIELKPPRFVQGSAEVARAMEEKCVICHPTVLMRRDRILELGGYRAAYECAEDFDLWLRVSERAGIDNLGVAGLKYRIHSTSVGATRVVRQQISAALAVATHRLRVAGKPDPTEGLTAPPNLEASPLLETLIPGDWRFFQLVDVVMKPDIDLSRAKALIALQDPAILAKHAKLWHNVLMSLALAAPLRDAARWLFLARAFRLHPGRCIEAVRSRAT